MPDRLNVHAKAVPLPMELFHHFLELALAAEGRKVVRSVPGAVLLPTEDNRDDRVFQSV